MVASFVHSSTVDPIIEAQINFVGNSDFNFFRISKFSLALFSDNCSKFLKQYQLPFPAASNLGETS
jgi:hypothetical protein